MKTTEEKFQTVIEKNSFYFFNRSFEEKYEGLLNSLKGTLLFLKMEIDNKGLNKSIFEKLLADKENGLKAILTLTGFSFENLKRLITLIRVVDDNELSNIVNKKHWCEKEIFDNIREWSDKKIMRLIRTNKHFRLGLVNIFFEGSTVPILARTIPLFELKKLSISKLCFEIPEMIDTMIRYKEKGSYSGKQGNNPEILLEGLLSNLQIKFVKGDLSELVKMAPERKRTMDFIIPNANRPIFIVECSFLVTTSSGQGDKSKTEISVNSLIKEHYPNAKFIGFIDGIGWYVRKNDLKRMVTAYDDVFTFHDDEISRFKEILLKEFKND